MSVKDEVTELLNHAKSFFADPLLFQGEIDGYSDEEVAAAFMVLKTIKEDVIEKRMAQARTILLESAEDNGKRDDDTWTLDLEDCFVDHQKRYPKLPDEEKIRTLLEKHHIDMKLAFDPTSAYVLNPSKLENLVKTGKLTEVEVSACYPLPSSALKVSPRTQTKQVLAEVEVMAAIPPMENTQKTVDQKSKDRRKKKLEERIAKRKTG